MKEGECSRHPSNHALLEPLSTVPSTRPTRQLQPTSSITVLETWMKPYSILSYLRSLIAWYGVSHTIPFNPSSPCIFLNDDRVVTQESNRLEVAPRPPIALTNAVSWRSEGALQPLPPHQLNDGVDVSLIQL